MAKKDPANRAHLVPPKNTQNTVVDLISNKTLVITEANPLTAGEDCKPFECQSVEEVAEHFKPKIEEDIKTIKVKADSLEESSKTIIMEYGKTDPARVMDDFMDEHVLIKSRAADEEEERELANQRLAVVCLENLESQLRSEKGAKLLKEKREALLKTLEEEIERLKKLEALITFV